jgi:hypothetical protein
MGKSILDGTVAICLTVTVHVDPRDRGVLEAVADFAPHGALADVLAAQITVALDQMPFVKHAVVHPR